MLQVSLISLLLPLLSNPQIPAESSCADCHFANPGAPSASHLLDWEYSAHGRNSVGCEKCHGGDASTFEPFRAHQGILNSTNPASPVRRANLPRTCGACHIGPFVAFQKSAHFTMLEEGSEDAPSCSTCHGEVAARLLSPNSLSKQCEQCHGEPGVSYHPEYAAHGRLLLELVREVRQKLSQALPLIERVDEAERRARLEEAYRQAEVPLIEAANAGHSFIFAEMEDRLSVALQRSESLLGELANP